MNEEISRVLRERFPVLERLSVQASVSSDPEPLPVYVRILLAVMNSPLDQPVCFVFPRRGDIARLSAILYGISNLAFKFPQLATEYAKTTFRKGQRVRVRPGGEVYIFDGVKNEGEIWLLGLQETWGRRIFPIDEILRLEPTEYKRPIGKMTGTLRNPPQAPLDSLIGTKTYGNQALIRNEVLILDSQGEFETFVSRTLIQSHPLVPQMVPLDELLPFGDVHQPARPSDSWFFKWKHLNSAGEPMIAITYSPETLADFCIEVPVRSKLLIINGIDQFQNHLQAYDYMTQTQRMVLFADHEDTEMMETLAQRGCRFWWLDEFELLADTAAMGRTRGVVSNIEHWARNQKQFKLQGPVCNDPCLEEAYKILNGLSTTFLKLDEDNPLTRLVPFCWKIFTETRSIFRVPTPEEKQTVRERLGLFHKEIQSNKAWIVPESRRALEEFVRLVSMCYASEHNLGETKGRVLLETLRKSVHVDKKIALLVRSENKVDDLHDWLRQNGLPDDIRIYSYGSLPMHEYFDHLIFVAWPGVQEMKRITARFCAPHMTVVCYSFEGQWLKQFYSKFYHHPRIPLLQPEEKAVLITGDGGKIVKWPDKKVEIKPLSGTGSDLDMWILEYRLRSARIGLARTPTEAMETLPARYVRFTGELYAFLTDSHKFPVVTDLLSHHEGRQRAPAEKTITEIKTGDFIVFPESGDHELIEELADKLIGEGAVELRDRARLWKMALKNSGVTPDQFHDEAKRLQRPRHMVTIRNWFTKTAQIGPQDKDDLTLVACVTNDKQLMDAIDDVQDAINKLRGAHLSAGMRLRDVLVQKLSEFVGNMRDGEKKIDMGELGSAVIVQVEHIDETTELRGRYEVNHLLLED